MRVVRLVPVGLYPAIAALGLVASSGGCARRDVPLTKSGLTPKEELISQQMADFEEAQKKAGKLPK
jgi:hypothetical protein